MKLPDKSPDAVIYFLAGTTPIQAHIHKQQLSRFGMISRLPNNILNKIAVNSLTVEPDSSRSWFVNIRHICRKYSLPSPLQMLASPISKEAFKTLVNSKIVDYWQATLREEAATKSSLVFFKPQFMSLNKPHPIFTSCLSNPFESNKSVQHSAVLSGRFKTDYLSRHWVKENLNGYWKIP